MQNSLFPEMEGEGTDLQPPGFRYQEQFLTESDQAELVESLRHLDLRPFEFHGHLGKRRVASFGLRYDYSRRIVDRAGQMPAFLNSLRVRVAEFAGDDPEAFRQVGVNEYTAGAGIGWHKDKQEFGIVVGVSLLSSATMRFRKANGRAWSRVSHILEPRSIYILDGEARRQWEHSIPPLHDLRYSITFRTLAADLSV